MSRLYDLLYTIIFKLNTTVRTTPMYLSESEKEQVKTNLGIKGSGGADLTGYATEKWVNEGYQKKGFYAREEDIPTKPEDIGAQPAGNYLTKVPAGYATEDFVRQEIADAELGGKDVDLSGYALKSELPTKVSQLQNDKNYLTEHQDISGKLDANKLPEAINTALAQAKASGAFDGEDGYTPQKGKDYFDGKDGYTPVKGKDYFDGKNGLDGDDGYTPIKGKDYFTEADKSEMVSAVIAELPVYNGEVIE